MKLKDVFLGVCIVALLASEFFLFSANRQKDALLSQLNGSREEAAQLQTDLDKLKIASATSQSTENDRFRTENASLEQNFTAAQNTIAELRAANEQLTQQLGTAREAVQLQTENLQQLQTENQQAAAAAQQASAEAQAIAERNTCINNLRQIDAAKNQWALENSKPVGAVPTEQDIAVYLKDNVIPVCPSGGTYTIGAVGTPPTCSIPGHVLP
jgi:chromosome segregation ATPase